MGCFDFRMVWFGFGFVLVGLVTTQEGLEGFAREFLRPPPSCGTSELKNIQEFFEYSIAWLVWVWLGLTLFRFGCGWVWIRFGLVWFGLVWVGWVGFDLFIWVWFRFCLIWFGLFWFLLAWFWFGLV